MSAPNPVQAVVSTPVSVTAALPTSVPLDEERWRAWQTGNRLKDQQRSARRVRVLGILVISILVIALLSWGAGFRPASLLHSFILWPPTAV
jgi:hypothetical protein